MIIDLRAYGGEVSAYVAAAKDFVERATWTHLQSMQTDLELGRDSSDDFPWSSKKPIRTRVADRYDRAAGKRDPVFVELSFDARFRRLIPKKKSDFEVLKMVTHIKVFSSSDAGRPALHIHVDKKNLGQLGPDMHVQVSEAFTRQASNFALGVPRLPTGFLLPTDCLDFVLSEFFPAEWAKAQTSVHQIDTLRNAQLGRARGVAEQLEIIWKNKRGRTPVSVMQNCDYVGLRLA